MPIYEYQAEDSNLSCETCRHPFEVLQEVNEERFSKCPVCGNPVIKIISRCHGAVVEGSEQDAEVSRAIKDYESSGMWSHAAELADRHSEQTGDQSLKTRALDNYKRAGHDVDALTKRSS